VPAAARVMAPVRIVHIRIDVSATTIEARMLPTNAPFTVTSTPLRSSSSVKPWRIQASPTSTCRNESGITITATITNRFCQCRRYSSNASVRSSPTLRGRSSLGLSGGSGMVGSMGLLPWAGGCPSRAARRAASRGPLYPRPFGVDRLPRPLRLRLPRAPEPPLGLRLVPSAFGHLGEGAPGPARELPFAELLGDADRPAEVLLGLVQTAELALGDSAFGGGVAELPPGAQVLEHGDRAVEAGDRLLELALVVQDPAALHRGHRDRELVADLLGERTRLVAEGERLPERPLGVGFDPVRAGPVDRERVEGTHARPAVLGIGDLERAAPDLLGRLVVAARPRHPAGEQQRPGARIRLVHRLRGGERLVEQLLRLVDVRLDVDRDVAEEPQRERKRERIVHHSPELHRPSEHLGGRRVLAQPIASLAEPGERARLADAPALLGARERERALVVVDRGAALR